MIVLGSDHGGYGLKQDVMEHLTAQGVEYRDIGCFSADSCDYPVYAEKVARAVASGEAEKGILICSTGIGVSMVANKVRGVRAALCSDGKSAELCRRHNDANVLALGALVTDTTLALQIVDRFLQTEFEGVDRHVRRLGLISALEDRERA